MLKLFSLFTLLQLILLFTTLYLGSTYLAIIGFKHCIKFFIVTEVLWYIALKLSLVCILMNVNNNNLAIKFCSLNS